MYLALAEERGERRGGERGRAVRDVRYNGMYGGKREEGGGESRRTDRDCDMAEYVECETH